MHDDAALRTFTVRPAGVREASARALCNEDREYGGIRRPDAFSSADPPPRWGEACFGSGLIDSRKMKLHGRAGLDSEVTGDDHGSLIPQKAVFDPLGLSGLLQWFASGCLGLAGIVFIDKKSGPDG